MAVETEPAPAPREAIGTTVEDGGAFVLSELGSLRESLKLCDTGAVSPLHRGED